MKPRIICTRKQLEISYKEWANSDTEERFGQYMMNRFGRDTAPWPELYYEKYDLTAYAMIYDIASVE